MTDKVRIAVCLAGRTDPLFYVESPEPAEVHLTDAQVAWLATIAGVIAEGYELYSDEHGEAVGSTLRTIDPIAYRFGTVV